MRLRIANFVLFYGAWFACVLSMSRQERWWWSLLGALVAVGFQLAVSTDKRRDLAAIVCAIFIGPLADLVLLASGTLQFPPTAPLILGHLPPIQMVLLWAVFATTFFSSLHWMISRPTWMILGGAIGGPAAYYAGAQLVAGIELDPPGGLGLLYIGIAWAIVLPVVVAAARHSHSLLLARKAA